MGGHGAGGQSEGQWVGRGTVGDIQIQPRRRGLGILTLVSRPTIL